MAEVDGEDGGLAVAPGEGLVLVALRQAGADQKPSDWDKRLGEVTPDEVRRTLANRPGFTPRRLLTLLSPAAATLLEDLSQAAHRLTRQRFGNVITLFAPLYLSNYCRNLCRYCGFHAGNNDRRRRLSLEEAVAEARLLAREGFRDILLVSGEDPAHVNPAFLGNLASILRQDNLFTSVGVEVNVLSEADYRLLLEHGIDGVTVFQETYARDAYAHWHAGGPKAVYADRLNGQEAAAKAGMRRLGLGALLGLEDWRFDAYAMAVHAATLMRHYWRSRVSFSFPRLRPTESGGVEHFPHLVSDRELAQLIAALRLSFPDAGMTLSTREAPGLRENLLPLGITQVSAGSKTNPGGYSDGDTGQGATGQFVVSDDRSPGEIVQVLRSLSYDPVWKDWDTGFQG